MDNQPPKPDAANKLKIGVSVVLRDADNKILLGKRKGVYGDGMWGLPGGHQKLGESIFECAKREVLNEVGIDLQAMSLIDVAEVVDTGFDYQLVELGYESEKWEGIFELKEHKYCSEWGFFDAHELPAPLFSAHEPIIRKAIEKRGTHADSSLYSYIQQDFKIIVASFVENSKGELLMGLRKDDFDKDHWAVPGGHLDVGETFEECALRELEEETGLKAKSAFQFAYVEQPITLSNKHYIHFGYLVKDLESEEHVHVGEPEDIERWEWFPLSNIPAKLAPSQREMILKYLKIKKISFGKK
jgi:8-oxo-dGTP diphosphatase